jgi:hypothetical protein
MSYPVFGFHGDVMAALTIPIPELIDGAQAAWRCSNDQGSPFGFDALPIPGRVLVALP